MDILAFDISGKFAHFRKFFANNTALTYSIPRYCQMLWMGFFAHPDSNP